MGSPPGHPNSRDSCGRRGLDVRGQEDASIFQNEFGKIQVPWDVYREWGFFAHISLQDFSEPLNKQIHTVSKQGIGNYKTRKPPYSSLT